MKPLLRPWRHDDLDDLVRFADNPKIASNLMDRFPHPYTRTAGKAFIEMTMQAHPLHIFAIDQDGIPIGSIGIHPLEDIFRKNAELGYWLAEPYWGKGIMLHAIKQMCLYTFENFELERIFARPFGSNSASQRVLEKAGFSLEGKFEKTIFKNDRYEDEWVYGMRRTDFPNL